MALSTADLVKLYSAQTTVELRKDSIIPQITTQDWTDNWASGRANSEDIPTPTYTYTAGTTPGTIDDANDSVGVNTVNRGRAGDWAAMSGVAQTRLTFQRSGGKANSQFIGYEDQLEAPWPVVESYRSRCSYEIRNEIETDALTAMRGYPNNTTDLGDGSARQGINPNGSPMGQTEAERQVSRKLVYDSVATWADLVEERDLNTMASGNVGSIYLILHPRLFRNLRDYLIAASLSWDALTESLMRDNSVLAAQGYKGRLFGVDIFSNNKMPIPSGSTAATRWAYFGGTQQAVAFNTRAALTQFFTPQENQITDQPGYVLRQAADYGILELEGANFMQGFRLDAHATD